MTEDPTKSAESLPVGEYSEALLLTVIADRQAQIDALRSENERLRREVGELRDALTPFAMAPVTDDGAIIGLIRENFDDARAALKAGKDHGHE